MNLLASDNSDEEDTQKLKINENYANKYDTWRNKEELQKLKDRYGDVGLNDEYSDSETSESEDDNANEWNNEMEKNFFQTLSLLKSKSEKIYDPKIVLFEKKDDSSSKASKAAKPKDKPFYLKDLEREMILKQIDKESGDQGVDIDEDAKNTLKKSYIEEQDDLKKIFKTINVDNDEDEDLFKVKNKSKEEKEFEDEEYLKWLKGRKGQLSDSKLESNMKYLHDYWNNPGLNEGERFLRDYILNKRYLDDDAETDGGSNADDDDNRNNKKQNLDVLQTKVDPVMVDLSEDEEIIEKQETFERKYNFRFEEPDPEFIKSYPRTITDTVRRKDNKRKLKREEYKQRKETEKQKKKEEIKRLKNLKRNEILEKINKIKMVTGNDDLDIDENDLDKDFDALEHDKRMQKIFDSKFYQNDENEKPVFSDSDPEMQIDDYEDWATAADDSNETTDAFQDEIEDDRPSDGTKKKKSKKKKHADDEFDANEDFNMDADALPEETNKRRKKQNSRFSQAISKKKPVFDPTEKTFEDYFDEYYKLDCEDIIAGELPCRFKYRDVVPNDFGLQIDEILNAPDQELNAWASLKKAIQYRPVQEELMDVRAYKQKGQNSEKKKKLLSSLYGSNNDNELNKDQDPIENGDEPKTTKQLEKVQIKSNKTGVKPSKSVQMSSVTKTTSRRQELDTKKNEKTANGRKTIAKPANPLSATNDNAVVKKNNKKKKKKKNKNILQSLSDKRLEAFGINPKKFKKKLKYSNNTVTDEKK